MNRRPTLLLAALALSASVACDRTVLPPEPLPDPEIHAVVSGAWADSLRGEPRVQRFQAVIDAYEFQLFTDLTRGSYQYLSLWGEGPRPRVGVYAITPWREGQGGRRMHAMFGRSVPGGEEMYQAIEGELRVTRSTARVIEGEYQFRTMAGYLLPEGVVLSPDDPRIDVRGRFTALCPENQEVCR